VLLWTDRSAGIQRKVPLRVLVADDHDLLRETVAAFLVAEGFEAHASVDAFTALQEVLTDDRFDLALVDEALPGMGGLAGLGALILEQPGTPLALMSASTSRALAEAALAAGACGFVPKKMAARAMVSAVRLMASGEKFTPMGLLQAEPAPESPLATLTAREVAVLRGICAGKSNKEIARDLDLQEVTVKLHAKTLCRKLVAKNRTHAAMIARSAGML
jgi:two-component system nitrate/nitrite response regulator NarL